MTARSNEKSVSASARVSIRQRRQGIVTQVTSDTSSALGGGRPAGTPGAQETSEAGRVKRVAAQGGLAALLYDALVTGQREAQAEEFTAQSVPANPALLAAIERTLLREKARRA